MERRTFILPSLVCMSFKIGIYLQVCLAPAEEQKMGSLLKIATTASSAFKDLPEATM